MNLFTRSLIAVPLVAASALTMTSCDVIGQKQSITKVTAEDPKEAVSQQIEHYWTYLTTPLNDKDRKLVDLYNQSLSEKKFFSEFYNDSDKKTQKTIDKEIKKTGLENVVNREELGDRFYDTVATVLRFRDTAGTMMENFTVTVDRNGIDIQGDTATVQPGAITTSYTYPGDDETMNNTVQEPMELTKNGDTWIMDIGVSDPTDDDRKELDNGDIAPLVIPEKSAKDTEENTAAEPSATHVEDSGNTPQDTRGTADKDSQ